MDRIRRNFCQGESGKQDSNLRSAASEAAGMTMLPHCPNGSIARAKRGSAGPSQQWIHVTGPRHAASGLGSVKEARANLPTSGCWT